MPTATTSQIMNNNECIEPYTENIYTRSTLSRRLLCYQCSSYERSNRIGFWNLNMIDLIKYFEGSIANIPDNT